MKIRFQHENLKVSTTQISGKFNIYSRSEGQWDKKLTKGSFKFADMYVMYTCDQVLEKISQMKPLNLYMCSDRFTEAIRVHEPDSVGYPLTIPSFIIFNIISGKVIKEEIEIRNPEPKKPLRTSDDDLYFYLPKNEQKIKLEDEEVNELRAKSILTKVKK